MKARPGRPPPDDGLRPEDRKLWQEISATLKPLKSRSAVKPAPLAKASKPKLGSVDPNRPEEEWSGRHESANPVVASPKFAAATGQRIDEKTARMLRRGKATIGARIDLHGRTQAQAHDELLRFLSACAARRQRLVLVITGKGERSGGLLRRSVPLWFGEPAFRELVSAYRTAGPAHGGEGALYVRLRNPLRGSGRAK